VRFGEKSRNRRTGDAKHSDQDGQLDHTPAEHIPQLGNVHCAQPEPSDEPLDANLWMQTTGSLGRRAPRTAAGPPLRGRLRRRRGGGGTGFAGVRRAMGPSPVKGTGSPLRPAPPPL
jgi:hypothetical protein